MVSNIIRCLASALMNLQFSGSTVWTDRGWRTFDGGVSVGLVVVMSERFAGLLLDGLVLLGQLFHHLFQPQLLLVLGLKQFLPSLALRLSQL